MNFITQENMVTGTMYGAAREDCWASASATIDDIKLLVSRVCIQYLILVVGDGLNLGFIEMVEDLVGSLLHVYMNLYINLGGN